MNTRLLMGASAIVLGLAGVAGLFLPQELLAALGAPPTAVLSAIVQLHGALLLGFAMIDWMAKDSLIGGIYNRPVLVGNVFHFATGALTLLRLVVSDPAPPLLAAAAIYAIFAVAFGMLMFRSP